MKKRYQEGGPIDEMEEANNRSMLTPRKVSIQTIKDRRRFNHYSKRWPGHMKQYAGRGVSLALFSKLSCQLNPNSKP